LTTLGASGIVDNVLAAGTKSGYTLTASPASGSGTSVDPYLSYKSTGTPVSTNTGTRQFCADESGVIRYTTSGSGCTNTSSALQ
jgi:hypothetical protein